MRRRVFIAIACLVMAGLCPALAASYAILASDDAAGYTAWTNKATGGTGFDPWNTRASSSTNTGYAGAFLASTNNSGLNRISTGPKGQAWGCFANGPGEQYFAAFRGFGFDGGGWANALTRRGHMFRVSFEHGYIAEGGSVGFTLRNGNSDGNPGDYNAGVRFEFGFFGGDETYSIYDAGGKVATTVPWRDSGLTVEVLLTSPDAYEARVYDPLTRQRLDTVTGPLGDSGSLDSVALYNRESDYVGEDGNVYFNSMQIGRQLAGAIVIK
jgi:hypothetical protein